MIAPFLHVSLMIVYFFWIEGGATLQSWRCFVTLFQRGAVFSQVGPYSNLNHFSFRGVLTQQQTRTCVNLCVESTAAWPKFRASTAHCSQGTDESLQHGTTRGSNAIGMQLHLSIDAQEEIL